MTAYIALLRKDPDSDIGVDFPDFPGCVTAGEALLRASTLDAIAADEHNRDAIGFLVDLAAA